MKFRLKGMIKLSREVPEAEEDLERFFKEAEEDILRRGFQGAKRKRRAM